MSSRHVSPLLLTSAIIITLPASLWANLAIFSTTDIQRTGNLVPIRKTRIELVNEKFTAKLGAETAQVTVDYEFVNTGADDTVTVGFPVDLMPRASQGSSYNLDHWRNDGLQDLRIIDGETQVPIERSIEETLRPGNRPKLSRDVAIMRRWSIAALRFKARERKTVRVSYRVRCMGVDEGFETYIPEKISPRTFLYTFRTANGWGPGRIRRLDIELDISFLRRNRFPVPDMEPKLKDKGGGLLGLTFQSAELNRVPDLVVRYNPKPALFQMYAEQRLLLRSNWKLSTSGPGKIGNDTLGDGDSRTAWTPDFPNSPGTCIQVTPRKGSYLNTIAILNGNQNSPADYVKHARLKKLRVEYILGLEEGRKHEVFEQTLPDREFDERVSRFPIALAQFLDLPTGSEGIIETVKLIVLEVYPGETGAPLAMSEIYVFGVNGKK
jgi:hypothetical protein